MPLFSPADAEFLEAVRRVAFANPFLPDRIELEREALGDDFQLFSPQVWSRRADADNHQQNLQLLATRAAAIVDSARAALIDGKRGSNKELSLYEDVVLYVLYDRFRPQLQATIEPALEGTVPARDYVLARLQASVRTLPGACPISRCRATTSRRTSSPASSRSAARFTTFSTTSSASRCHRRDSAVPSGNPSSRMTCAATSARSTTA